MSGKRFCRRPWGFWLVLIDRKKFKVKLLRFKQGRSLSVQYHNFRNELWLILNGIYAGTWKMFVKGELHSFYAIRPTWVLEVQFGERCVEEDIVRV